MITVIYKADAPCRIGDVTMEVGENSLDIRQWMDLKMHPSIKKRMERKFLYVKNESEEKKAIDNFKHSIFETLMTEGYSLVKKRWSSPSDYKGFEHIVVTEWLSANEDAALKSKEKREIDSLRFNKITCFTAAAALLIPIVLNFL